MEDEGSRVEVSETLAFPILTDLRLAKLGSLTCFSREKCSREDRSKDHVQLHSNVLFNREVSFPILESLTIEGLHNLKEIWSDKSPLELSNLRSLKVMRCKSLLKFIGSRSLVRLHKLQTLCIKDCSSVQEIFDLEGPSANGIVETLSELTTLKLKKLGSLRRIWNEIASGIMRFHNLKEFKLDKCDNLEFIFFPSMAKSLAQLGDLTVSNCKKMDMIVAEEEWSGKEISETLVFPMLTNLTLTCLESLTIFSCGKCSREGRSEDRVNSHSAVFFSREVAFPRLETLAIDGLDSLRFTFSPSMVKSLTQLRKLSIQGCKTMEAIIMEEEGLRVAISEYPAFPMLTDICLEHLESLTCFFCEKCSREGSSQDHVQLHSSALFNREVAFPRLETLEISNLDNFRFMFFPSMVESLTQLRKLSIWNCKKMESIIMEEDGSGVEISETLVFPMLTDLCLNWLESLTCFSREKCSQKGRSQDHVQLHSGALFNREVSFPKLKSLEITSCDNLRFIFLTCMVKSLGQLRKLSVSSCKKMEAVIMEEEGLGMETSETLAFSMLTDLSLRYLESLRRFFHCSQETQSQDHDKSRSSLLFSQEVSFPKLESLEITSCDNLRFIFFTSMVKSLGQLRKLSVSSCEKMEAIIMKEEELRMETSETPAFPMLTDLFLQSLESLRRFSHGSQETQSQDHVKSRSSLLFSQEVAFPRLETLEIDRLDNLRFMFSPSTVRSLTQLRELKVSSCEKMEAIIMEEEGFEMEISETLAFSMLTDLSLVGLGSLTCFSLKKCSQEGRRQDHIQLHSSTLFNRTVAFPRLKKLKIDGLDNLRFTFFPSMVKSLTQLKKLCVRNCEKMEAIIMEVEGSGVEISETSAFPMLTDLSLAKLGSLTCFSIKKCSREGWSKDNVQLHSNALFNREVAFPSLETLRIDYMDSIEMIWDNRVAADSFPKLKSLRVDGCKILTSLFPTSIVGDLMQLEELEIRECGIAELIEKEEGVLFPKFVFPNLTSLKLKHLSEVKSLYSETHTSHWPALKTLKMDNCNKVEILASQIEDDIPCHKQSLFLIEKGVFPNLQELKLDLCDRMEIWHGDFHDEEFFRKLRVLELRHLSKESAISTSLFIESLTNLEELVVCESYLEERSSDVEAMEGPSHEQKVILPFSRQIKLLKTLDVSHCDGLSSMFTPTIAENLVALTKLRISNCRILAEVLHDEEGEERREVAFSQLKYMELDGLIELRCFSSGGQALRFPLLEDVIVNGCPNMEVFSKGPIKVPKLEKVQVCLKKKFGETEYQHYWNENLNVTIQNMFKEMSLVAGDQFVRLFEFPELIEKWHNDLNPLNSSWQLKTLLLDKCPSFINAMPSKLMLVLEKMTSLQVGDCESLEEIFDLQGLEAVESTRVLPCLEYLKLTNLPKLRQLWNKDLQGTMCFNSLSSLTLYKCSNLKHVFSPSMAWCLANIGRMEIRECNQMEGVIEEEEGQGSSVEKITFSNLEMLELERLPNLTSFLSGKDHALDCPKIRYLTIAHCPKMRSLTWKSSMEIDHSTPSLFTPRVQFLELRQIVLSRVDNISKIWPDDPLETLTFDSLESVEVQNCKSLENVFPHWLATSLTQLEKLQVESCRIEEIVANGDDTSHSNIAQVLFPKLTALVLHDMPRLKTLCPNLPTLNWPFLKELRVTHCDKVNMSSFAASINKWTQRNDQQDLLDQEAHSLFERDFPNLDKLLLVENDIQIIEDGKFPDDIFGQTKAITLACFHEEKAVFPTKFLLERFQNLKSLEVFCSSFEDIFPDEGLADEGKHPVLGSLTELKLSKLHKLKCLWREDYLVSKFLQSIKTLEVWDCPSLTTLFPAVTSFHNLTKLVVKNSSGLVHLATASALASLVNLTDMTIIGCEKMKEVVAKDENGEEKVISFRNLHWLRLQNMPSLECFSSTTSCILRFPSLWRINVEECPKMNIFSKGTLSTPELEYGTLFRYDWNEEWKGDLNRAIRELSA